jgi:hypothetical protein
MVRINYSRLEQVAIALSRLQSVRPADGSGILGCHCRRSRENGDYRKPSDKVEKQALAAIGQAGLIKIYSGFLTGIIRL